MSDLAEKQAAFMRAILDEDAPLPEGWGNRQALGMSVYRGNYRSALVGALESTFERTARYVGEATFKRVCAHHALANPPSGWTIDEAGEGFDATCAELFANNPEVAELAWLEWTMLQVANAPDCEPIDADGFAEATAAFGDEDWMGLRVQFQPRAVAHVVRTNLSGLWNALEDSSELDRPEPRLAEPRGCIVAREQERPVFQMVEPDSAEAFALIQAGGTYGELILHLAGEEPELKHVQKAAMRAGAILGEWVNEGLVTGLSA
ncbi:putative DNA-binding domain-containing protein [Erythrobacter sp. GH1-10]|uniref:HvfC/BufC family peptide modification chaperone n=1 Tax=Erythrobacter sp. GH1-10 TaxID=3349334 RepID=UPI003878290F